MGSAERSDMAERQRGVLVSSLSVNVALWCFMENSEEVLGGRIQLDWYNYRVPPPRLDSMLAGCFSLLSCR